MTSFNDSNPVKSTAMIIYINRDKHSRFNLFSTTKDGF